jgi:hypothetical protein
LADLLPGQQQKGSEIGVFTFIRSKIAGSLGFLFFIISLASRLPMKIILPTIKLKTPTMRLFKSLPLGVILFFIHPTIIAQDCTLNCPSNIVVKADAGMEGALVSFPPASTVGKGNCGTVTYSRENGSFFRLGSHSVIVTSSTGQKCSFTVTVSDNEPPYLSPITLSRELIWPASNKMKKVVVNYTATDKSDKVKTAITVKSNATDGVTDYEIISENLIRLKSSRLPDGSPRIYSITVTATLRLTVMGDLSPPFLFVNDRCGAKDHCYFDSKPRVKTRGN